MKRFLPLIIGLSTLLFSFTIVKNTSLTNSNFLVTTLFDICEFKAAVGGSLHCAGMPAELTVTPDCEGTTIANVLVANLHSNPIIGQQYSLPSGVPAMYIETEANGVIEVTDPITTFDYNGRIKKVGAISYPIFEHECALTFDMFESCTNGSTSIMFDAKLTLDNGTIYPVIDYSGSGEIFQYDIFNTTDPDYTIEACAEHCNGCPIRREGIIDNTVISSETFTETDVFDVEETVATENVSNTLSFEVTPNPFVNDITLTMNKVVKSPINVEIMGVNGKVIVNRMYSNLNSNLIKIDGSGLSSGIYYCRVISNGKAYTKKIVKY